MTKLCTKCNCDKPLSEFNRRQASRDGHTAQCRSCVAEGRAAFMKANPDYYKRYRSPDFEPAYARKRVGCAAYYRSIKENGACCVCGESAGECLDLHHVDEKLFTPAHWQRDAEDLESLISEVAKCVVLCANHHRMVHLGSLEIPADAPRADTFGEQRPPLTPQSQPVDVDVPGTLQQAAKQHLPKLHQALLTKGFTLERDAI